MKRDTNGASEAKKRKQNGWKSNEWWSWVGDGQLISYYGISLSLFPRQLSPPKLQMPKQESVPATCHYTYSALTNTHSSSVVGNN